MKLIKPSSNFSNKEITKSKTLEELNHGITKRLIEKYKPKSHCNIETFINKSDQKGVA